MEKRFANGAAPMIKKVTGFGDFFWIERKKS